MHTAAKVAAASVLASGLLLHAPIAHAEIQVLLRHCRGLAPPACPHGPWECRLHAERGMHASAASAMQQSIQRHRPPRAAANPTSACIPLDGQACTSRRSPCMHACAPAPPPPPLLAQPETPPAPKAPVAARRPDRTRCTCVAVALPWPPQAHTRASPPIPSRPVQTVSAQQATQMARPLPKQQPVDKGKVWAVVVGGATVLFGATLLAENNGAWFPAISRANEAMRQVARIAKVGGRGTGGGPSGAYDNAAGRHPWVVSGWVGCATAEHRL